MITDNIRRWRHRCGFGVHSPLAFRLVKDVFRLPSGYSFYGETELRRQAKDRQIHGTDLRKAIWLLRLSAVLGLKHFYSPDKPEHLTEKALQLAGCLPTSDIRQADLLLDMEGGINGGMTACFLQTPYRTVWTSATKDLPTDDGLLTLRFPEFRIILSRPGMAGTEYDF